MRGVMKGLVLAIAATLAAPAMAENTPWQALTRQDAEAGLAMIEQNHPGARPEVGDRVFLRRLGGYWIALETLGERAEAVATQVGGMQAQLRAAPLVVLDLRGNGGGNSDYSDRIAKVLAGKVAVDRLLSGERDCQGQFWRASPENGAALRTLARATKRDACAWSTKRIPWRSSSNKAAGPPPPAGNGSSTSYLTAFISGSP